jgi:hypothetical protein
MSIVSRFFGNKDDEDIASGELIANPDIEHPISLQVLFRDKYRLDAGQLAREFRSYHHSTRAALCEIDAKLSDEGKTFGMVGWEEHVIRLVGFNQPMPSEAVKPCITASHYGEELKEDARAHKGHLLLYYAGYEDSPLEQYVALAATAGVLARIGAIVVLNESGHTSFPAAPLSGSDCEGDIMELLRTLPLLILYCGFVKHEVEGISGVWMRTYGASLLGLPDLAAHARGHAEGQRYFDMFENILGYLRESGSTLAPGHTMELAGAEYLRFRTASEDEWFLENKGTLLVAEVISPDEINH